MATPKQFRRRGRWTLILGTLFAALTVGAVMAFASSSTVGNSITWTGQGVSNGTLNSELCSAADDPFGANQPYLQWNLTQASGITAATLTINGTDTYTFPGPDSPGSVGDSVIKFFTPFYDLSPLPTAVITYTGTLGSNPQFTISHGCVGIASPEISTDASGDGVTGDALSDTAHLTGGFTPPSGSGGSVTFTLYGPGDTTCSTVLYTDVVAVEVGAGVRGLLPP